MECSHSFKLKTQIKSFDKKKFKFEAQTCTKCDLYIWDEKTHQVALDKWLLENKIKFQVSFKYKNPVIDLIKKLSASYGVDDGKIIKTLLSLYLKYMRDPAKTAELFRIYKAVDLKSQSVGEWKVKGLRLTPSLYYKLKATCIHEGIEDENFSEFVRMAIEIIISPLIYKEAFQELKDDLETVLIAA